MEDKEEQLILSLQDLRLQERDEEGEEEEETESMAETESFLSLKEVEEIIGYSFNDQGLLEEAFTHGSYRENVTSYERLEFVGDSVLNLLIANEHYFLYPDLPPGKLTRLRAANVDTEKLARVAVKLNLHKYLRHKKPLFDAQIRDFLDAILEYPLHSYGLIDAPKVLADMVESTVGALFIDSKSMDTTWKVVKRLLEPIITPATLKTHPMTKLYEICQKNGYKVQFVDEWKETGEIDVSVNNEFVGKGIFRPKRLIALNRAANNAYYEIVRKLGMEDNDNDH